MDNGSYDASEYDNQRIQHEIFRLSKSVEDDKTILKNCIDLIECQNMAILDLGCGPGATTNTILECSNVKEIWGIDRELRFIEYAKKKYKNSKLFFTVGEGEKLPFEDNYFDCCFSRYVFQHLKKPDKVLQELIRVTKPLGRIGIYEWDEEQAYFSETPKYYTEYISAEKVRRRFTSGDICMGSKLKELFLRNNMLDIKEYNIEKNTISPGRDALWSGQKWMGEIDENHPYVKLGLMKLEHLKEYYFSLKDILLSEKQYVCYTDVFTIGRVNKI